MTVRFEGQIEREKWSGRKDSNLRPLEPHSTWALNAERFAAPPGAQDVPTRAENSGKTAGQSRVVLGPCPCSNCRQPVIYDGHAWRSNGERHRCGETPRPCHLERVIGGWWCSAHDDWADEHERVA